MRCWSVRAGRSHAYPRVGHLSYEGQVLAIIRLPNGAVKLPGLDNPACPRPLGHFGTARSIGAPPRPNPSPAGAFCVLRFEAFAYFRPIRLRYDRCFLLGNPDLYIPARPPGAA